MNNMKTYERFSIGPECYKILKQIVFILSEYKIQLDKRLDENFYECSYRTFSNLSCPFYMLC